MIADFPRYTGIIETLKLKIRQARLHAVLTVNTQMLAIYWEIGETIAEQEQSEGWGKKIVETLAKDLKIEFPDMRGFSLRNLRYMRDFALAYPNLKPTLNGLQLNDNQENVILQQTAAKLQIAISETPAILQQLIAKLPWAHHILLLDKTKDV